VVAAAALQGQEALTLNASTVLLRMMMLAVIYLHFFIN
jgi:hypothetical protein